MPTAREERNNYLKEEEANDEGRDVGTTEADSSAKGELLKAPPEISTGDAYAPPPLREGGDSEEAAAIAGTEVSKCSCLKSQCLKLYCECLKDGAYCNDNCVCKDCHNIPAHDGPGGIRLEAIRYIVAKKPNVLPDEMKAMAYAGGWEPPENPLTMKSPFVKQETTTTVANGKSKGKSKKGGKKRLPISSSKRKRSASDEYEVYDNDEEYHSEGLVFGTASAEAEDQVLPYNFEEFPQLALDPTEDHSSLASAFVKPLFDEPNSRALTIAYTHQQAVSEERRRAQRKKNAILHEYNVLREKLQQKKLVLSLANDKVKHCNKKVGAWNRKVFDLELEEPCSWNENYRRLKAYRDAHGRLPPSAKKATNEEEKSLALWIDRIRGQKNLEAREEETEEGTTPTGRKKRSKNKMYVRDYPHRLECLANLGVVWESHHGNKWETMFQKLLLYKEEMGTLRFPTDDQCVATGDVELIALQKWVKGQVLMFRYGKKKHPEFIKRLEGIGFDFEKWYAKPGKAKKVKTENGKTVYADADGEVRGGEGAAEVEGIGIANEEEGQQQQQHPQEQQQQQHQEQQQAGDGTMIMDSQMPANEEFGEAVRVQYAI